MAKVVEIQQTNIIHKVGTSKDISPSSFTSWLDYWEKNTNSQAGNCVIQYCTNKATDGAHIQLTSGSGYPVYIIPTCHSCNMKSGQMRVNRQVKAVSI